MFKRSFKSILYYEKKSGSFSNNGETEALLNIGE